MKKLSKAQMELLVATASRHVWHNWQGGLFTDGKKRYNEVTVNKLHALGLVHEARGIGKQRDSILLRPTDAGRKVLEGAQS